MTTIQLYLVLIYILFHQELHAKDRNEFFNKILKDMIRLALMLPDLCTQVKILIDK